MTGLDKAHNWADVDSTHLILLKDTVGWCMQCMSDLVKTQSAGVCTEHLILLKHTVGLMYAVHV